MKYELTIRGFNGASDKTDDKVIWVEADLTQVGVEDLLRHSRELALADGTSMIADVNGLPDDFKVDYVLPRDLSALIGRVNELVCDTPSQQPEGPVTMFWHGGQSYSMFDVECREDASVHDSVRAALEEFERRGQNSARYPDVGTSSPENGGASAWLFFGESHPVLGREHPDATLSFGPTGGVLLEYTGATPSLPVKSKSCTMGMNS